MASSGLTRPHQAQWLIHMGYNGSRFHGVQPQPGVCTAGGALLARVLAATGHVPRAVSFAARTDAGVHAQANLVSLRLPNLAAVNAAVEQQLAEPAQDDGLVNVHAGRVGRRVMARAMACSKHYRYVWTQGSRRVADAWAIVPQLDVAAMRHAAAHLVGTHDFSAWRAAGCSAKNPRKTLSQVALECSNDGQRIALHVVGTSFLRQMMRIIAGTLAEVGCGLRPAASVLDLLSMSHASHASQNRTRGVTAPACGLTLMSVQCAALWNPTLHEAFPLVEACA